MYTRCCIFSATSAPLANQQIPLISHFGLEHFQNIHPFFFFYLRTLKDVLMDGCIASVQPELMPLQCTDSIMSGGGEKNNKLELIRCGGKKIPI